MGNSISSDIQGYSTWWSYIYIIFWKQECSGLNAPPKMVYRSTVRTALSEELLQESQRKEQSLLRTIFIGRSTTKGCAGALGTFGSKHHNDCQGRR